MATTTLNDLTAETTVDPAADFLHLYDNTAAADRKALVGNVSRHRGTAALASLPTTGITVGDVAHASDGRKSGEGGGSGTGIPVWWDGTNWKTFYDNATAAT